MSYRNGILPVSSTETSRRPSRVGSSGGGFNVSRLRVPKIVRRILRPKTLDFEVAAWEVVQLLVNPQQVNNSLWYRKQTKNQWARDDPSFVLLLSGMLSISAIAWGLSYSPGVLSILRLIVYMVGIDFLLVGAIVATIGWLGAERVLKADREIRTNFGAQGEMEWAYCFDVHCNGFLYIWLLLYVVQFGVVLIFAPESTIGFIIGNTLYFGAFSLYFYSTFMGYATMPFLEHTELLLVPIGGLAILWLGSLLFGFDIVRVMVGIYFG